MTDFRQPSRQGQFRLTSRRAGTVFLFLALGLGAGLAWRCLFLPRLHYARVEIPCAVRPSVAAADFDWAAKLAEWRSVLNGDRQRRLLGNNLRYALKLAATRDQAFDTAALAGELALFAPDRPFPASLLSGMARRFGPSLRLTTRDIAANLDFQSLAMIVSDLDPAAGAASWDFSFFAHHLPPDPAAAVVVRPGRDDPRFQVFHHLHELLNGGRQAFSAEEAWRTAVDHLDDRLNRESRFAGGGGFGRAAAREILREIAAVPALAANSLYHASGWPYGDGDFSDQTLVWNERWTRGAVLDLVRETADSGLATLGMEMELYPLSFPRDTVLTRISPLATATLAAFLAERERVAERNAPVRAAAPPPEPATPQPPPDANTDRAQSEPAAAAPIPPPTPEEFSPVGSPWDRQREAAVDVALRAVVREREALLRGLDTARDAERGLAVEAVAARARVDRLKERYDEIVAAEENAGEAVSLEAARLLLARNVLLERLATLLQTCTEEHPFVRQARRELAAVDALLADEAAAPTPVPEGARIRQIELEWRTAVQAADNIEERRRLQAAAIADTLTKAGTLEARADELRDELARLRRVRVVPMDMPKAAPPSAPPVAAPVPETPAPAPITAPAEPVAPRFELATPGRIAPQTLPAPWTAPFAGALLGTLLGVLWMLAGMFFPRKFADVEEARRSVPQPVLAVLPGYDSDSVRKAAATMRGELAKGGARAPAFIPVAVEFAEPAAAARRGAIHPAKKRRRILSWIVGAAVLACACLLCWHARDGLLPPAVPFSGELAPPAPGGGEYGEDREEWGDLP